MTAGSTLGGYRIDAATFALFVHAHRWTKRKLAMRPAATASGVSTATISRAENRQTVGAANYLALCLWIGANPFWFLIDPVTGRRIVDPPEVPAAGVSRQTQGETS